MIRTKSGNVYPKDEHDWQFWSDPVKATLNKAYEEKHKVVILSNQAGLKNPVKRRQWQTKVENIVLSVRHTLTFLVVQYHA